MTSHPGLLTTRALLSLLLAGCGTAEPIPSDPTGGSARPVEPPAATPAATAGVAACALGNGETGDVDGDGAPDRVAYEWTDGGLVLWACLGTGAALSRPAKGQGELLDVIDLDEDGRDEILNGGTTVSVALFEVTVVAAEGLQAVLLDGAPYVFGAGPNPAEGESRSFGCGVTESGEAAVVDVTSTATSEGVVVRRTLLRREETAWIVASVDERLLVDGLPLPIDAATECHGDVLFAP